MCRCISASTAVVSIRSCLVASANSVSMGGSVNTGNSFFFFMINNVIELPEIRAQLLLLHDNNFNHQIEQNEKKYFNS